MVLKIGHRGACGHKPENTLVSFEKAIKLEVDIIELDVRRCKTGEIVVIHDDTVDRTTNGNGAVKELTLDEIKALDAGKGEKIPTLRETLELVDGKAAINIELKEKGIEYAVNDMIEEYVKNSRFNHNDFIISSFDMAGIKKFHELNPKVNVSIIIDPLDEKILQNEFLFSVNLNKDKVDKDIIESIHKRELKVFVWTVNEKDEIEMMKKLGVDGIFSNFPERI